MKCKNKIITRFAFLALLAVMLLGLATVGCTDAPRPLKFLALTDTHIATGADLARFRDFLHTVRGRDVEFIVVLGDITAHQPEYLPGVRRVAESSRLPVYLLPGNHDDNYAHNSQWWGDVFPTHYYRFSHEGYHFIMNWSQDRQAPLPWLAAALDSIAPGEPIVFCQHFPPSSSGAPDDGVWPLLAARRNDLAIALSGHTHRRMSDTVDTIRSETLGNCSMDSSRDGFFYEITLDGTKVEKIEEFTFADLALETPDNSPPKVEIENDEKYFVLDKPLVVRGTADDNTGVEAVQWQLDSGKWQNAEGAGQWSVALDPASLAAGHHLLRLRGLDTSGLYSLKFTTATLYAPGPPPEENTVILSQGNDGYDGCADITVKRHDPQANSEDEELDCWVYGHDGSREFSEIYIRFGLDNVHRPRKSAKISGVRLELFCCRQNKLSHGEGDDLYRVGVAGERWDEEIAFDTRPGQPGWLPSSADSAAESASAEWPVPADVQAIRPEVKVTVELDGFIEQVERWLNHPQENRGWVISPVQENYNISFCPSEHAIASLRPRLVIEFE